MVEITVKAVDSASAMEEIEKRLGADAMIVSTNRVDGQIEIVATNDDPSKYHKTPEPLVLDKNYRIKGFSEVLNSKLSAEDKPLNNESSENHIQIAKNAENIKGEIDKLVELSTLSNGSKENESSVSKIFQMSGIKKSLIENTEHLDSRSSIEDASKILAKAFINGKCDHFESSTIYLVTGNDGAGKTLFTKKLKNLFETQIDAKSCTIFEQFNGKQSQFRGQYGELKVSELRNQHPHCKAWLEAAKNFGLPGNEDFNSETTFGVGEYNLSIGNRWRSSSATAFLKPAKIAEESLKESNFTKSNEIFCFKLNFIF